MAVRKEVLFGCVSSSGIDEGVTPSRRSSWGTKLRHGVGADFDLMRCF